MNKEKFDYSKLDRLLKMRGMTLYGLTRELKIAGSAGTKWRNGGWPSAESLKAITSFFDVPMTYFLDDIPNDDVVAETRLVTAYNMMTDTERAIVDILVEKYVGK